MQTSVMAQIGLNTTAPEALLDVNGFTKINEKLYLEGPGDYEEIRGSKLLVEKNDVDKTIVQYDIENSKYGPINYAEFKFENVENVGVQDYDTKIPINKYSVTVQGFYFRGNPGNQSNIVTQSSNGDGYIEGSQVYAYKNTTTNTWFIRAFVNNSIIRLAWDNTINADIYLNLIIYRIGLLAKEVNMKQEINAYNYYTSGKVPKPTGF